MWLFNFDGADTWWDSYLWNSIQRRLKPLREEKLRIVQERLWLDTISRPEITSCDAKDIVSIYRFLARENLDCAFNCDPDTSAERVGELCDIILWALPSNKHIHIIPHENTESAAKEKGWSDMLGYFEVWIKDDPQVQSSRVSAVNRFTTFFIQALWSSRP